MAVDFKSVKTAEHCTFIVNTWRGRYIDDAIADIADQIEREARAPFSRMRVLSVISEMERLLSGHEVRGNDPTSRWVRELRDALGEARDHAADGRPLREGETVYLTDSPTAFVIDDIMTREDGATVVHLKDGAWHRPQDLTHERPDSWERLEEDATLAPLDYVDKYDIELYDREAGEDEIAAPYAMSRDLVRRAKALAEMGQ